MLKQWTKEHVGRLRLAPFPEQFIFRRSWLLVTRCFCRVGLPCRMIVAVHRYGHWREAVPLAVAAAVAVTVYQYQTRDARRASQPNAARLPVAPDIHFGSRHTFVGNVYLCASRTVEVVIIGKSGVGKTSLRGQVRTINCLFVRDSLCEKYVSGQSSTAYRSKFAINNNSHQIISQPPGIPNIPNLALFPFSRVLELSCDPLKVQFITTEADSYEDVFSCCDTPQYP